MKPHRFLPLLLALVLSASGCKPGNDKAAAAKAQIAVKIDALRQSGDPVTLVELNAWERWHLCRRGNRGEGDPALQRSPRGPFAGRMPALRACERVSPLQ